MRGRLCKLARAASAVLMSKAEAKTPLIVGHNITFRCNLSCKYCGIWSTPRKEMTTAETFRMMGEFARAGCISWNMTGGEAFLKDDIDDVIFRGKDLGMAVSVNSNGFLMGEHIEACRALDLLSISVDGPQREHDLMRGKGSFRQAIAGVKLAKSRGVRVSMMSVLSPATMADGCRGVRELIALSRKLGVQVAFQPIYGDRYNRLAGSSSYEPFASKHPNYRMALGIIQRELEKTPKLFRMSGAYVSKLFGTKAGPCNAGLLFCYVFPDGMVSPCFIKEEASVDGRKRGFLEAFRRLPAYDKCNCYFNCHSEWNSLLFLDPRSVLHYASNYF